MNYLSDVNLRAVLTVLISRSGGTVDITNGELYDAMLPGEGRTERFLVEETPVGLRVSVKPAAASPDPAQADIDQWDAGPWDKS